MSYVNRIIKEVDFGSIQLPVDFMSLASAIVGIRGSGKTTTAVVACEGLLEHGQQVVIIDPLDGWFGLKSSASGDKPAYPVIVLGGRHGDAPLAPEHGGVVADFVVDQGASVILSLRHLESNASQRGFVTDFARRLFFRKGQVDKGSPILVVIDEASLFVPQRVGSDEAQMVGAIQKLVRQGRSSGIGVMLIDQRPASVNKDVLSQIELLITHRIMSPQDQKALMAWVEQHDAGDHAEKFKESLPTLLPGTTWFWSPGWMNGLFQKVKVRRRKTFDSSATPKIGESRTEPKVMASIDLDALRTMLTTAMERANDEDPSVLRARIKELETALKSPSRKANVIHTVQPAAQSIVREVEVERVPAKLYGELLNLWRTLGANHQVLERENAHLASHIEGFKKLVEKLGALVEEARFKPVSNGHAKLPTAPALVDRKEGGKKVRRSSSSTHPERGADGITSLVEKKSSLRGERRVLYALRSMGGSADKVSLAVRACYKHSAGGFQNILSMLRTQRLVEDDGSEIKLTAIGEVRASQIGRHEYAENRALIEEWKSKLDKPARLALDILASVQPEALSKKEIAERAGYVASAGGFQKGISQLRANKLVTEEKNKKLRLAKVLA